VSENCPFCSQPMPTGKNHSPREANARLLQRITGGSLNFCRKAIVAVMEMGWNDAKTEEAVKRFATPGMAPWEWSKDATQRKWRAEPEPEPLPDMSWQAMADAAGLPLEKWKEYHGIR